MRASGETHVHVLSLLSDPMRKNVFLSASGESPKSKLDVPHLQPSLHTVNFMLKFTDNFAQTRMDSVRMANRKFRFEKAMNGRTAIGILVCLATLLLQNFDKALALDPKRAITQYVHDIWTTDNGLPQNAVSSIIQSRDGYLWFGTQEGLVRFDGLRFTVFDRNNSPELPANVVQQVREDHNGNIWIGLRGPVGVSRLERSVATGENHLRTFTTKDGLAHNSVISFIEDRDGVMWFATQGGLSRFKDGRFTTYTARDGLPSDTVFSVDPDSNGGIILGTARGLSFFKNGKFTNCTTKEGLASDTLTTFLQTKNGDIWVGTSRGVDLLKDGKLTLFTTKNGLSQNIVNAIFEDGKQNIWFAAKDGLNLLLDTAFTSFKFNDRRADTFVAGMYEDRGGNLWLSTGNKGLMRFSMKQGSAKVEGKFEIYSKENGLIADNIQSVREDKEGSLWIGTYGGGLHRLRDGKFTMYSAQDGLSSDLVNAIFVDKNDAFWIGTFDRGVTKMKDGAFTIFTSREGLANDNAQSFFEDRKGDLWIGTNDGLNKYSHGKFTTYKVKDGLSGNSINAIAEDSSGDLWFGSAAGGLNRLHDGKFTSYRVKDGLSSDVIFSLYVDRHSQLWIGTLNSLSKFSGGTFTNFSPRTGEALNGIFDIHEDADGLFWLATAGNGICRFKDNQFAFITPKDGLFDYNAYVILEDDLGNLWTDCNKGIYSVSRKELNDLADGKIKSLSCMVYGTADGMRNRECNGGSQPAGWKASDGRLCFATVKGVAIIDPKSIKLNTIPPPVVIERAVVDNQLMNIGEKTELSPGTEKFEFHYAGISFVGPEKVIYKYKLEGFENDWVDAGTRREAFYTHIPHGEYTFRVAARNNDGVWNEAGATATFIIKPYFYQTGWFYALCIFGFVGIGPGVYTLRVRQLKRRELELMSIVRERTKELQHEKEKTEQAFLEAEKHREEAEAALGELKDAQRQLVLSEKMASLGQLTAGIAHEIKNPLNFVNNFAALSSDLTRELRDEVNKQKDRIDPNNVTAIEDLLNDLEQNVTKINDHGKRADSIVKGMLLHSRGKSGERQPTDINALLAEYVNLAYHGLRAQDQSFNIKIETEYDPSIGVMNVVPQNLSRVFLNIVNNGCYSTNEKKKTKGAGFSPTIWISTKNFSDKVEIRIRDNGNGIPKSVLDKIFNPFFTTKPTGIGTGLGLSLSYDIIVQEHKGEIKVDTKEGEFAEFIIILPKRVD